MSKFSEALKVILHHEGGYVNHPKDPGGETNLGVTKRVYEEFGGTKDMKELTQEDVEPIYKHINKIWLFLRALVTVNQRDVLVNDSSQDDGKIMPSPIKFLFVDCSSAVSPLGLSI